MSPKPLPKRLPRKILAIYIDTTSDSIRRILMWTFDPNTLSFNDTKVWNSGDLIADDLALKTVIDKLTFEIKAANETGSNDTLPTLLIWDTFQLNLLKNNIPILNNLLKKDGIVILQDRCYDLFKYNLTIQTFGLQDIADVMSLDPNEGDYAKFARIALYTEKAFKDTSKQLRKNGKNTTKTPNE